MGPSSVRLGYFNATANNSFEMNGTGSYIHKKGIFTKMNQTLTECYSGNFNDDLFHGNGRFITADLDIFDGEWEKHELMYGQKTYSNRNIEKVFINGTSKMIYENNEIYEGNMINCIRNGHGKMTYC